MVSLSFGGLFRAGTFERVSEIGHPVEPLQSPVYGLALGCDRRSTLHGRDHQPLVRW
jgi:hypothetical protein